MSRKQPSLIFHPDLQFGGTLQQSTRHLTDWLPSWFPRSARYDRSGKAWQLTHRDFRDLRALFGSIDSDGSGRFSSDKVIAFALDLPAMLLKRHRESAFGGEHDDTPYHADSSDNFAKIDEDGTLRLDEMRHVKIEITGGNIALDARRNIVGTKLNKEEFDLIGRAVGIEAILRYKDVYVAARQVSKREGENVVTRDATTLEGTELARQGDYVVTAIEPSTLQPVEGETWIVSSKKFQSLYTSCDTPMPKAPEKSHRGMAETVMDHGNLHLGKNLVDTLDFRGGIVVATPWGNDQNLWRQARTDLVDLRTRVMNVTCRVLSNPLALFLHSQHICSTVMLHVKFTHVNESAAMRLIPSSPERYARWTTPGN